MITRRERELLGFIHGYISEHVIAPSYTEMMAAMNLSSKSGIHRLIHSLESSAYLRLLPDRARAIEVIRMPDEYNVPARKFGEPDSLIRIPFRGVIGPTASAKSIAETTHTVTVPFSLCQSAKCFALQVRGDAMVDAGVLDGDTVVIREAVTPFTGDIILAVIDGRDAVLRRMRRKGAMLALEAAGPPYQTQFVSEDRVKILGKMVGLKRLF